MPAVKEALNQYTLSELIGLYLTLYRDGAGWKAYSPFKEERSPSFKVSDQKETWHCFSTDTGGKDAIEFVKQYKGIDFKEALQELAQELNIPFDEKQSTNPNAHLYEAAKLTQEVFLEHQAHAIAALKERGFNEDTVKAYGIGYAPGGNAVLNKLKEKGYTQAGLQIGAIKQGERDYYDFFRGRYTFPITSKRAVIAWGGRDPEGGESKYINSPNTEIYQKQNAVFGLKQALPAIRQYEHVYLVEGYTDAMAMYQLGSPNTIALCSKELTAGTLSFLSQLVKSITIALDDDTAGRQAKYKSIPAIIQKGLIPSILDLPEGCDPGDLIAPDSPVADPVNELTVSDGILYYAEIQKNNTSQTPVALSEAIQHCVDLTANLDRLSQELYQERLREVFGLTVKQMQSVSPKTEARSTQTFWSEKVKNGETELKLDYAAFKDYLQDKGYYIYNVDGDYTNEDSNQFIHLNGKIATMTNPLNIAHTVREELEDTQQKQAVNLVAEQFEKVFSPKRLRGLLDYPANLNFNMDTQDTAYLYFANSYVEITAEEIRQKDYSTLQNYIWDTDKRAHNFEWQPDMSAYRVEGQRVTWPSDFAQFMWLVATGKGGVQNLPKDQNGNRYNPDQQLTIGQDDYQRFFSMLTAIGYLVTSWKNPAYSPAIVAVDARTPEDGEPNGRTGKSLLGKAISRVVETTTIDARNFDFNDANSWENVSLNTRVINMNDTPPKFKFDRLFSMITEGMYIKKMYASRFFIPFDRSPKFYINTNYVLGGEGASNQDRQFIIEFADYFSEQWRPEMEFGRTLFYDWDKAEWDRFYTFIAYCVQLYLEMGLYPFPLSSYDYRKLTAEVPEQALNFFEDQIQLDALYPKQDVADNMTGQVEQYGLVDIFRRAEPDFQRMKSNTFMKWLKAWVAYKGYMMNPEKNGERDRRNGVDYIQVSDPK